MVWWFLFFNQMKQLAQMQQQQQQQQAGNPQQQQQQQQQQPPTPQQQQQDRLTGVTVDVSNSFGTNDPVYGGLEPSPSTNSTGTGKVWMHVYTILLLYCWMSSLSTCSLLFIGLCELLAQRDDSRNKNRKLVCSE
jgi:hypothetical protein